MPASEAQILANRRNAALSTGPKTAEGKERSRANALKHGLTGDGIVLSPVDAPEVERLTTELEAELRPSGNVARALVRRVATCIVRMERSVAQETATLNARVLEAQAEAEAKGEDPIEAGNIALFDPSKEATLARKYEAAAERGMYRALRELRQIEKPGQVSDVKVEATAIRKSIEQAASFFPEAKPAPTPIKPAAPTPPPASNPAAEPARKSTKTVFPAWNPVFKGSVERADHDWPGPLNRVEPGGLAAVQPGDGHSTRRGRLCFDLKPSC